MIYAVRHRTTYRYARPVELGSHLAHVLPRDVVGVQRVRRADLLIEPAASFRRDEHDHWGNRLCWISVEEPHPMLVATAEALVEVSPAPARAATPPWEAVASIARSGAGWAVAEFLLPSPKIGASAGATALARSCFPPGTPVLDGLLALSRRVHREFRFRAGATTLRTSVDEVLARREGVCQDFTHLMIAGLRGLGLPARYTSGYIHTRRDPAAPRRAGADVSHAWVGAWLGPEQGWIGLDPTNDLVVGTEHVILGWGRDFSDVSPLFGVILGGGSAHLEVAVELRALDGWGSGASGPGRVEGVSPWPEDR